MSCAIRIVVDSLIQAGVDLPSCSCAEIAIGYDVVRWMGVVEWMGVVRWMGMIVLCVNVMFSVDGYY